MSSHRCTGPCSTEYLRETLLISRVLSSWSSFLYDTLPCEFWLPWFPQALSYISSIQENHLSLRPENFLPAVSGTITGLISFAYCLWVTVFCCLIPNVLYIIVSYVLSVFFFFSWFKQVSKARPFYSFWVEVESSVKEFCIYVSQVIVIWIFGLSSNIFHFDIRVLLASQNGLINDILFSEIFLAIFVLFAVKW